MFRALILILMTICMAAAEESMEDVQKRTDMGNADSVYAFAEWCETHNKPTRARQLYGKVIELDKDHEAARAKMGQVRVGERWVAANGPGGAGHSAKGDKAGTAPERHASGPGPTAQQVKWDLTPPKIPEGSEFAKGQVERMNRAKNDSDEMDSAVRTLMRADCRPAAVPCLCAALLREDYTDLYGPCQIVLELVKGHQLRAVRPLLGFLVAASARVKDPEDLETFAYTVAYFRDRRVLPRLIELMDDPSEGVRRAATGGAQQITLLPKDGLTSARVKAWWDLNHDASEQTVLAEQLRNADPKIAIEAAKGLFELKDKSIVPVVIRLLKVDDHAVNAEAISMITRLSGSDWSYEVEMPADNKGKIAAQLEKWWKEKGSSFIFPLDPSEAKDAAAKATSGPVDPATVWVVQLSSTEGNVAQAAESNLLSKGKEAVAVLLGGLASPDAIVRRKSNELLKNISKKDVGYDSRGSEEERGKAIAAWRTWASSEKIALPDDPEAGGSGDTAAADAEPTDPKPAPKPKKQAAPARKDPVP
jgi:hypothetical protein